MTKSKAYGAKPEADYDSGRPDEWPPDWPPPDEDDDPLPPDWPKPIPDDESYTLTLTAPATTYPCLDTNTVLAEVTNTGDDSPASALLNHGIRLTAVLYDTGEYLPVYMRKAGETAWSDRLLYSIVLLDDGINYGFEEDIEVWLDGTHDSLTITFNAVIFTLEAGPSGTDTSGSLIGAPCGACPGDCSANCGTFVFMFGALFEHEGIYSDYNCLGGTSPYIARYKGGESSCQWPLPKYCRAEEGGGWEVQPNSKALSIACIGNFWYIYSADDFDAPGDDDVVARLPNTLDYPPEDTTWSFYNHKALGAVVNTGSLECVDCDDVVCEACEEDITATISGLDGIACDDGVRPCSDDNVIKVLGYTGDPPDCEWKYAFSPSHFIHVYCYEGFWYAYGWSGTTGLCWVFKQPSWSQGCPPKTEWVWSDEALPFGGGAPKCTATDPSFTLDY